MAKFEKGQQGNGYTEVSFVNYSWRQEDDANYEAWLKNDAPNLEEVLEFLLSSGYKLSLAFDFNERSYRATFICAAPKHVHNGFGFSAWADSADDAIYVAAYKILVLFADIVPDVRPPRTGGRR